MHSKFLNDAWGGVDNGYILIWSFDGADKKQSQWFQRAEEAAAYVENIRQSRTNIYMGVGLSPKNYGKTRRCMQDDVIGICGMWADIDIADEAHKKPNLPPDEAAALALLAELPFEPSYVINSGHGLQAWWLFREPWTFDNEDERREAEQLSRRFNVHLRNKARAHGWDVDMVYNLDRVMRVPGTTNHKGSPKPVNVMSRTEARYNPDDFDDALPSVAEGADTQPGGALTYTLDERAEPPFDKFFALCEIEPKFKASWDRARKDLQDQSASSYDLSLARYAYMCGWSDQEVATLIIAFRRKHGEDLKLRKDYYDRTLQRARNKINEREAVAEIMAHVESHDVASVENAVTDPNHKESILQSLSSMLGVQVIEIARYVADPPLYKIKTAQGSITLGEVDALINQSLLRSKIAAATGRYIPRYKSIVWDRAAQALLDCCIDIAIGDEATESGEAKEWIAQYLESKPPYSVDERTEALSTGHPFRFEESGESLVALSGADFRKWLRVTQQEKINPKKMGLLMRGIGGQPRVMGADVDGKKTSRSYWVLKQ